jgi:hypothetical protein
MQQRQVVWSVDNKYPRILLICRQFCPTPTMWGYSVTAARRGLSSAYRRTRTVCKQDVVTRHWLPLGLGESCICSRTAQPGSLARPRPRAHIVTCPSGSSNMAIEQLFEALPVHYLQHGISKFGAMNVALAVIITASLGVLADYAWMLYMRSKMVSLNEQPSEFDTYFSSLQDRCLGPSSETRTNCQTTSHGYTSRSYQKDTTRH